MEYINKKWVIIIDLKGIDEKYWPLFKEQLNDRR